MSNPLSAGLITVPKKVYVAVASADAPTELNAFDDCLVKVGLDNVSLVKVTSILPADVELVERPPSFPHGANVPSIYVKTTSCRKGDVLVAAMAIGWTGSGPTLVAEYGGVNVSKEDAEKRVLEMLNHMARTRGLELKRTVIKSVTHVVEKCGCALVIVAEVE